MKEDYWEKEYKTSETDYLWGLQPNAILLKYAELIPKNGKVLDIGVGEGRNALFFAKQGFTVEGIDISETAIQRCLELSQRANVKIDAKVEDITSYEIKPNHYSLIILSNVLNFFPDHQIEAIIEKVKEGLSENGLVYINVFDNHEPGREKSIEKFSQLGENSFYNENLNMFIHYFTKSELEEYFSDYRLISLSQSYSLDLTHGDTHYHSTLEIMAEKPR